MNMKQV